MARTKSGCWTCRLQTKKKCDEAKPTCQRCLGLGVFCFGYGPRPSQQDLRGDRRALIASVGAASRTRDSTFRVWRLKPESQAGPRQTEAEISDDGQTAGCAHENGARQPCSEMAVAQSDAGYLLAPDRPNSSMLNFLHPQLLANYTDKVFWLDSRFYECPGPYEGNAWMKDFLVRSKETHLAASLMGLTWRGYQLDISRLSDIEFTRPLMLLHSLVIQSVKDEIARSQNVVKKEEILEIGVNLAKCASILLIFEVIDVLC